MKLECGAPPDTKWEATIYFLEGILSDILVNGDNERDPMVHTKSQVTVVEVDRANNGSKALNRVFGKEHGSVCNRM